jgi:hypothetical protein
MKTQARSMAIMSISQLDNERSPRKAKIRVTSSIPKNCTPMPTYMHNSSARTGGLKT